VGRTGGCPAYGSLGPRDMTSTTNPKGFNGGFGGGKEKTKTHKGEGRGLYHDTKQEKEGFPQKHTGGKGNHSQGREVPKAGTRNGGKSYRGQGSNENASVCDWLLGRKVNNRRGKGGRAPALLKRFEQRTAKLSNEEEIGAEQLQERREGKEKNGKYCITRRRTFHRNTSAQNGEKW